MAIAIDGPVAVGKTTVGRLLANRLGYRFIDTGNMYRALAWQALRLGIDLKNEPALVGLAQETHLEIPHNSNGAEGAILVNGVDISRELRQAKVEQAVSLVARVAGVRQALVSRQREMAQGSSIVMVGRDIGTVVLPLAEVKVFLQASPQERARRRYQELLTQDEQADYQVVLTELLRRDKLDSGRSVSPLRPAANAIIIDTETITPEEVAEKICRLLNAE